MPRAGRRHLHRASRRCSYLRGKCGENLRASFNAIIRACVSISPVDRQRGDNLPIYQHIVAQLKSLGHVVLTEHVADPNVLVRERKAPAREVYQRDVDWLNQADVVIAEISTPSLGVGYEIGYTLRRGTPTLCVYCEGLFVSKMITGNPSPHLTVATYRDERELDQHLIAFLDHQLQAVGTAD